MDKVDLSSFLQILRVQFGEINFDSVVLCTGCPFTDGSVLVIEFDGLGYEFTQDLSIMVTETEFVVINRGSRPFTVDETNAKIIVAYPDTVSQMYVTRMSTFEEMRESFSNFGKSMKLKDFLRVFVSSQKKGVNKDVNMFTTSGWCC